MSPLTHVYVTVPEGREVPIPASEASAAGVRAVHGKVYALPWSTYTRRRIAAGDLILATESGAPASDAQAAAASSSTKLSADGSVDPDQRTDEEINLAAEDDRLAAEAAAARPAPAPRARTGTLAPTFTTTDTSKGRA